VKALAKALIAFAILLLFTACANQGTNQANSTDSPASTSSPTVQSSAGATKINVTEKEMAINLSPATAPAGSINFVIYNSGKIPHEFVVFKTNLPDTKLPLKGSSLDEEGKGVKHIAEIGEEDLKSGATKTLSVNLAPGHYILVCNLPGHFQAGMKTDFIVKPKA